MCTARLLLFLSSAGALSSILSSPLSERTRETERRKRRRRREKEKEEEEVEEKEGRQ